MRPPVLLEHCFLPGDIERQNDAVAQHCKDQRYHEGLGNLTSADAYFGRAEQILRSREKMKRKSMIKLISRHRDENA